MFWVYIVRTTCLVDFQQLHNFCDFLLTEKLELTKWEGTDGGHLFLNGYQKVRIIAMIPGGGEVIKISGLRIRNLSANRVGVTHLKHSSHFRCPSVCSSHMAEKSPWVT